MQKKSNPSISLPLISLLAIVFLIAFQVAPLLQGNSNQVYGDALLQRARVSGLTKNILIIAYGKDDKAKAAAHAALLVSLPLYEQEETALAANKDSSIAIIIAGVRGDYLTFDSILSSIANDPDKNVSDDTINVALAHGMAYNTAMQQVITVLQDQANTTTRNFFICEAVLDVALIGITLTALVTIEKKIKDTVHEQNSNKGRAEGTPET